MKGALYQSVLAIHAIHCHPPSQKSLRFLPHTAKVWGCHPVRWNLNAAQSRMLPVCCQSCGLPLNSVHPHSICTRTCIYILHLQTQTLSHSFYQCLAQTCLQPSSIKPWHMLHVADYRRSPPVTNLIGCHQSLFNFDQFRD